MKLISAIVALAILLQPISAAAYNSCRNDRYENFGDRTCITHCMCGSLPETCGCCSTNCTTHESGNSSPSQSSSSSSSSSGNYSPIIGLVGLIVAIGCIYYVYQESKKAEADTSYKEIRPPHFFGFAF